MVVTLQRGDEFFSRHLRLPQEPSQRTDFDLSVHGYHATLRFAPHDDVAAALANLLKSEMLQRANNIGPGDSGKSRHARALGS